MHASDQDFIVNLTEIVVKHLSDEHFGVDELIRLSRMSDDVLRHRLKKITKKTITQFIAEIRLTKAHELLLKESLRVNEVAWRTGFSSPEYFIRCYRDFYGYSPGDLRKWESQMKRDEEYRKISVNKSEDDRVKPHQHLPIKKVLYSIIAILLFCILGYVGVSFLVMPYFKNRTERKKISIAILPFVNDSPDSNNVFFFNRLQETISENLSETGRFSVTPRRTVETYRNDKTKASRQIARELNVNYLIEGSGQKSGTEIFLTVHLFDPQLNKNILSLPFREENNDESALYTFIGDEIIDKILEKIQSGKLSIPQNNKSDKDIAALLMDKATNLRAHGDKYPSQRALNDSLAERAVNESLLYDSTNADAYNLLSNIYLSRNRIDTALILNEKAIQVDKNNARAYNIKAKLLPDSLFMDKKKLWEKSIRLDPDYPTPYSFLGTLYWDHGELAKGLIYKYKALKKLGLPNSPLGEAQLQKYDVFTYVFCDYLISFGYFTTAKKFADDRIKLVREYMAGHVLSMLNGYLYSGRGEEAIEFGLQHKSPDYVHYNRLMGYVLMHLRNYDEAVKFLTRGIELTKEGFKEYWSFMLGFALIQTGKKEEGEKMLDLGIRCCNERINNPANKELFYFMSNYRFNPCISLACIYAVRGEKGKALEYLDLDRKTHPSLDLEGLKFLEEFPMLDNIRNEPEFKEYYAEAHKKFSNEKRQVERFLRREKILPEE
jgi:AraC-like DNA-binding protein/TolB-like protein